MATEMVGAWRSTSGYEHHLLRRLCSRPVFDPLFEQARFEKQFMHHKAPRKLVWKPSLGCVTLDVAFADKTVKAVKCSPLHATILVTFGEQPKWNLSALATQLKVDAGVLKRRMVLWINRGFIHEVGRTPDGDISYEAPSHLGAGAEGRTQMGEDEEDGGGAGGAAEAQLEAEMRVYEQYVIGMLTNLESLPLGRIHNMLRMFVPAQGAERGYDRSEAELQRFLNRLVEDGKLEVSAGQFKIRAS
jgi:anaphase-promoting complex subunit 2